MQFSLKEFVKYYCTKYQTFINNPIISNVYKKVNNIDKSEYDNVGIRSIEINYLWNIYNKILDIDVSAYDKKNDVLFRGIISIKRNGNELSLGSNLIGGTLSGDISKIILENKDDIFEVLLNYPEINTKLYNIPFKIANSQNDYICLSRDKNFISFIIYRELGDNLSFIETKKDKGTLINTSREFGILLDTKESFVRKNNSYDRNRLLLGSDIEEYVNAVLNGIMLEEKNVYDNMQNVIGYYGSKQRRRRKNEKV